MSRGANIFSLVGTYVPARQYINPLTHQGNLALFLATLGKNIRYVEEHGKFIVWSKKKWLREDNGARKEMARQYKCFVNILYRQARSKKFLYTRNGEPVSQDDMLDWAKSSSQLSQRKALFELLKDEPLIRISQSELDRNPYVLGVANGVVDMRTGGLRENTIDDLITRYARATFNPKAEAPEFEKIIDQACLNRKPLVEFIQEVVGIIFSGLIKEQKFFLMLGTGANSKSTIIETLFYLLGDYAKGMPSHAFIKSESRAIRNDLARLPGVRFAPCAEVNTGKALDESMVKRATGGDVMTARFIGKEFFDFHLTAKFVFSVNTLPRVTGADNGIYRRLVVIPFDADFSKDPDMGLPERLKGEIDGILNWGIQGFQRWHQRGHLVLPDCVVDACKAYRTEMDTVQAFLDDCCDSTDPNASTPLGVVYDKYLQWGKTSQVEPAKPRLFGTLMGQKGFKKIKSGSWRWKGVTLKGTASLKATVSIFGAAMQPQPTPADTDSSSTGLPQ